MPVGRLARHAAAALGHYTGLLGQYRHLATRRRAMILMYHRVLEEDRVPPDLHPGMFVTRRTFEKHLRLLQRSHAFVTIDEIGEWLQGRIAFERPPCALTFDDGWLDNYETAFPLLKAHGATATIFLITGNRGTAGMMSWDQVLEMERSGIVFGSHTVSHVELGKCDAARIRRELAESRDTLQQRLSRMSEWFCFPKGSYSPQAVELVKEYYEGAVTTDPGWVALGDDPLRLRRIGVHDDMSWTTPLFAWRLALLR
jgi:peptidoglycan/xylan/chitin deacetylase (PgdA/CDA1 family)